MTTIQTFDALGLPASLLRATTDLGYQAPTPIQAQAAPPAMEGRDVLGTAMTGSGKTAAFLLPVLTRLMNGPRGKTRALVLAPTRELAAQIEQSAVDLAKHTDVRVASVFGGVGMKPQERALRSGTDLIVATPGRLLDHMQHPYVDFSQLEVLVLDEADRMLDMGFLPDIKRVMRQLPAKRQTLLFSATMPGPILELSRDLLRDPVRVGVERKAAPATGVTQSVWPVPEDLKTDLLLAMLRGQNIGSVIVFTRTKHRANRLAERLQSAGVSVERIHGNRSQTARTDALSGFKSGRYRVLVATDIAARGIDVEALGHVVNFDVPNIPEDYIHRSGRTARAEATGEALTFVSPAEETDLRAIERAIGRKIPRQTLPDFDYRARAQTLEVPLKERIAEIRARKSEERARAKAKAERKAQGGQGQSGQGQGGQGQGGSRNSGQGAQRSGQAPARGAAGGRPAASQQTGSTAAEGGGPKRRRRGGRGRSGSSSARSSE